MLMPQRIGDQPLGLATRSVDTKGGEQGGRKEHTRTGLSVGVSAASGSLPPVCFVCNTANAWTPGLQGRRPAEGNILWYLERRNLFTVNGGLFQTLGMHK